MAPGGARGSSCTRLSRHGSSIDPLVAYLGSLRVTQGRLVGELFEVLPWQRRFLRMAFGAPGDCALTVGRGNGKTTLVAAIAAACVDGPLRQPRSEVVVAASSFLQSRIMFEHLTAFLGDRIRDRSTWRLWDSTQAARLLHIPTGASVRCIGSDPKRMHGLAPVLILADEPAQWEQAKSEAALAALRTGLGKIPDSRLVALGTRPDDDSHWFSRMLKEDRALTYAARPGDSPYWRRTWRRANPSLDIMPDLEARLREEAKVARRDPVALASFEALRLNLGVSDVVEQHLLSPGAWSAEEGIAADVGPYVLGLDLGTTEAMSAAAGYWPETGRLSSVACFGGDPDPKARGLRDGVGGLYAKMEARGELILSPGRVSDLSVLIDEVWERWGKPSAIVCDRWREAELRKVLSRAGWPRLPLVVRGMGYRDMGQDLRDFLGAFLRGLVTPERSLLLSSAMASARTISDPAGNRKLAKRADGGRRMRSRDDAACAAILAVALGARKALQGDAPAGLRSAVV